MAEKVFEATDAALADATAFIEEQLETYEAPMKVVMQMTVVLEELFVNVAHYAYGEETGTCTIVTSFDESTRMFTMTLIDSGSPFDPLAKEDPDVTLKAEDRKIGGLGIFMSKKMMDDMSYTYVNGENRLTCSKVI